MMDNKNIFKIIEQEDRILVATTCAGTYEKYLDGWVKHFDQIQYRPLYLDNFIATPDIKKYTSGEEINNAGRQLSIETAVRSKMDWILFLDVDIRVDIDVILKFLKNEHPFIAGTVSARDDPNRCIGHVWEDKAANKARWLTKEFLTEPRLVDSMGGGLMMVHKKIFTKLDLTEYKGPQNYENDYTGGDMFFADQVYERIGFKPLMDPRITAWHLYGKQMSRLWGLQEFSDKEVI